MIRLNEYSEGKAKAGVGPTLNHLSKSTGKGLSASRTMRMKTIILLIVSNVFMTIAWYGHLKYRDKPLVLAIVISWLVALLEYSFQVPANRIGAQTFSLTQLKVIQECITLVVFTVITYCLFGERLKWNNLVSYALIGCAVYFSFGF